MPVDTPNEQTFAVMLPSSSQTANFNSSVIDLKDYVGRVAVILNAGGKTAGDAGDTTLDVRLYDGSESNGANATILNINATQVTTANSHQVLEVDTRSTARYLKAVCTIAGTNSPAFPVSMTVVGTKNLQ